MSITHAIRIRLDCRSKWPTFFFQPQPYETLRVEQVNLRIENRQFRWFRHLFRMCPGHLHFEGEGQG